MSGLVGEGVTTFDFEGEAVRTITIDGEPWFVGRDVCRCLGIENPWDAMGRLDDDERRDDLGIIEVMGRTQKTILISDFGIHSLVLMSSSPTAMRLKKWLTSVVLPALNRSVSSARPMLAGIDVDLMMRQVRETRLTFGPRAAQEMWRLLGLPDLEGGAAPGRGDRSKDLGNLLKSARRRPPIAAAALADAGECDAG